MASDKVTLYANGNRQRIAKAIGRDMASSTCVVIVQTRNGVEPLD
jgi:hypothetical protein